MDLLIVFVIHLIKTKKEFKNSCTQEIQILFTKNDLDEACFQHDVAYGKYKDLTKRTQSDKALKIASNPKYDGYQRGLASMVYKFFDKNSRGAGIKSMSNQQLK